MAIHPLSVAPSTSPKPVSGRPPLPPKPEKSRVVSAPNTLYSRPPPPPKHGSPRPPPSPKPAASPHPLPRPVSRPATPVVSPGLASPLASPNHALPQAQTTNYVRMQRERNIILPEEESCTKKKCISRRCCCIFCPVLILLLIGASIGVLSLVFHFQTPIYSITNLTTSAQVNLTSSIPTSLGFNITINADNPNGNVGIYYRKDSDIRVFYNSDMLNNGHLPVFYHPVRNITVIESELNYSHVVLGSNFLKALQNDLTNIALSVRVYAPVKLKFGAFKTWKMIITFRCEVVVDGLSPTANIISHGDGYCTSYKLKAWPWQSVLS